MKRAFKIGGIVAFLLLLAIGILTALPGKQAEEVASKTKPKEKPAVIYEHTYGDLTIKVLEWTLDTDADTGKVIVNIPIEMTNRADHAYTFFMPHFSYNGTESVFTVFNAEDEDVTGKISRLDYKDGTISITLETREPADVETLNPTFNIYDMKSEKEINLTPELKKP